MGGRSSSNSVLGRLRHDSKSLASEGMEKLRSLPVRSSHFLRSDSETTVRFGCRTTSIP